MKKRIVLLSDGTGNAASKVWRTNVWRVFQALDLTSPQQVALYNDGVGTSSFKPLAILGGAFGWGLKRNVLELYKFLCRNYQADAEIFAFGFSRGAFTVRVLTGLVSNQGIVRFDSEADLHSKAKEAYRAYRGERYHSILRIEALFRGIRNAVTRIKDLVTRGRPYDKRDNIEVSSIRFIGVWDTVAAYGLPIEEMTRGVSQWLWPLELPDRTLSKKVIRACHALAIDDERTTFHPVLWSEAGEQRLSSDEETLRNIKNERLTQLWFTGVHSNVGGGYPDDSLAHIPLVWMMKEAQHCGLLFKKIPNADPDALLNAAAARDKDGRLYNPRAGMGGYYRYGPRKIFDLCHMRLSKKPEDAVEIETPKIHASVFERTINGAHNYAPIGLPARYEIVNDNGDVVPVSKNPFETSRRGNERADAQEGIWNLVWGRRVVYFLTLGASFHLIAFPLFHQTDKPAEFETPFRMVSEALRLVQGFVPGFFKWWLDAFATNPGTFVLSAVIVAGLIAWGARLGGKITDRMRKIWSTPHALPPLPTTTVYKFRTHAAYRWFFHVMRRHVMPFVSVVVILYVALALLSHLLFNIQDAAGLFCRESATAKPVPWLSEVATDQRFDTRVFCWGTGISVERGKRYIVSITQTSQWRDAEFEADVGGFEISELPTLGDRVFMTTWVPMRRVFLRPWFRMIGRVGTVGADEYFLDPDQPADQAKTPVQSLSVTLRPRRNGELFLYVNDAALPIPGLHDLLYRNNSGEATVVVKHILR